MFSNRNRFSWRLRAPVGPDETRRIERWLATARVFLAISAWATISLDPTELSSRSSAPYWLLRVFIAHSVVVMLLLRWRRESTTAFRVLVHAADILWPALISVYATGQRSPFFLFFVFVLLAAAYRWGLWETMGTAMAAVALLWTEGLLLHEGIHPVGVVLADFVPKRLIMRSVSLVITGLFLGYLAEQQKQLRAEKAIIARILAGVRVDLGLTGTLQAILRELLTTFGAKRAVLASQESNSLRVFVGRIECVDGPAGQLTWLPPHPADREIYLSDSPGDAFYAVRKGKNSEPDFSIVALCRDGSAQREFPTALVARLAGQHAFHTVASVSFVFGKEWWGRIFLFDIPLGGDLSEELHFLQELVSQIGPAVYNVYLLRRLRMRAGAVERARVARELHDGAVQSLIAMEMQVDVARRHSAGESEKVAAELGRIQGLLREEVLKLRELMQEMKSIDVDARKLPAFLTDTIERFQRETGISARFIVDLQPGGMEPRVCRELVRIVQEGLVNVRKHSKARDVLVRLVSQEAGWKLTIEDNGQGFDFDGRMSHADLDNSHKGPLVIKERVRLIDGQLTIESMPGQGARLEIIVPQQREAAYG